MKRIFFSILFIAFTLTTTTAAWATDCGQYENKIHWQSSLYFEQGEEMYCHEMAWPFVFSTGHNASLVVTDISDPDHPVIAANYDLPTTGNSMQHRDDILFIVGWNGLMMTLDVSNPLQPAFLDSIITEQHHVKAYLTDDHAWVNSYHESISIVDLSQPDNLTVLGTLPFESSIYGMIECGSLAYIGTEEDWNIFDFSNPSSPELIAQLPDPALSFALEGQTLLVGRQNEIATYDVSDPAVPVLLNTLETEYEVHDLEIHNGLVSALQPGVEAADLFWLLEDGSLEWITGYSGWYLFADVFLSDEYIYFCNDTNINLINLADLHTVTGGDHVDTPGVVAAMEMNGSFGFFPMGNYGLIVYDFEDPQEPVLVGSGFTPHGVTSIVLRDNYAYLAGYDGLSVLDVTDPTLPHLVGTTDNVNSYDTLDISLDQNTIWLAEELRSVSSVDVSDPAHPQPGIILPFRAMAVEAKNGLLHTISGDGIYRIHCLATSDPEEIANIQLAPGGSSIEVIDNLVLVGHYWYGLSFLDISDPHNPVLINHIKVMGGARRISVKGHQAVISNYRLTHILDISDPLNVDNVGTIWDGGINHTILAGGEIVVHHYRGYIYSLQVYPSPCGILSPVQEIPLAPAALLSIHPNPFNPQTTISFDLPNPSAVTVQIYDLTGRLVQTLASGQVMSAGLQTWTWLGCDTQGRDVSSGVYLVRLEADQFQTTGRMVLVR